MLIFLVKKVFGYNIFNVIPTINDNITYGMLFITGLFTSIHCISMCGAINLMSSFNRENKVNLKRPNQMNKVLSELMPAQHRKNITTNICDIEGVDGGKLGKVRTSP